ncbi:MAG TPA: DNA-directed RNA polymerase subunit beta' [Candidatus Kapabacteria bacterium]|nr:DNA-directed RNA polymerase subunit beta' [Candidatus Kapabacteria bacterium]
MAYMLPQEVPLRNFASISVGLSSPDSILARSHGEVTKPETINYRSYRPEKDGLFCEKIFGPTRDWECYCGKYKRIRYKGIICDRCGVEVTTKSVRRERFGHIELAVPVVHIWYFRSLPNKIGHLLGMPTKDLEKIVYYESYTVVNAGPTGLPIKHLLTEEEYFRVLDSLPAGNQDLSNDDPNKFIARIGGEAVKELLRRTDIEALSIDLRRAAREETSQLKRQDALKRLRTIEAFREEEAKPQNKPEWMVMNIIPVIPPELRPLVPLEGGRFATSDLNDLYRRVIIRNNRLKRLMDIKAPEVILRNEKRMLQEAVDSLLDNSRRVSAVRSDTSRALKSLSDTLKGKQGRFRQNLLGKRVDYSGRSVIVVGPELKLHECGLPKEMAVELFKPFIIRKLIERGIVKTVKSAKKVVERKTTEVWDILESIIDGHPIMLNRAPTLHRLGIQAFQPRLVEGRALQIHPLVCTAFNADFDGDQMAVHVPLSYEAQLECSILMLSSHNIISPQNGEPIAVPSQDMVLGAYYLTKHRDGVLGQGGKFSSANEVIIAYNLSRLDLHAKVHVRVKGKMIETTTGRVIFNQIVPEELGYLNELLTKKRLRQIIATTFRTVGNLKTVEFLDKLKDLGFGFATKGGLSVALSDIIVPKEKDEIIAKAQKQVDDVQDKYLNGFMTSGERYNKVIDIWTRATNRTADKLFDALQHDRDGFNPLYMMVDSGARGSKEQVRQLAGMRGLMAKPQKSLSGQTGELIENPIISNFHEGLSILEYFISTHGARKGLADTALKTADAGYLTRRLIDAAQDAIIGTFDCGTIRGIPTSALKEGEDVKEPLSERILGRVSLDHIIDPLTQEVICEAGGTIDEEVAARIASTSIETVLIRSVLTCEARRGVCAQCYGRNLTTHKLVEMGEAVGIIAAQSIGEPGTQLTLRTFHTGGAASLIASQSQVTSKFDGVVQYEGMKVITNPDGEFIVMSRSGVVNVLDNDNRVVGKFDVPYGARILVRDAQTVTKGEMLYEWDPYNAVIISEHAGMVRFKDFIENVTFRNEADELTGNLQVRTIDSRDRTKSPTIDIVAPDGHVIINYIIPSNAVLQISNGDAIETGTVLVKIAREAGKQRDITGGLPRVTELFEARSPSDPATVSEIDGTVHFEKSRRGSRVVAVTSHDSTDRREYTIPFGKHILVQEGDAVRSSERLSDGSIDPHDILAIKGVAEVQQYLVNEIQEVYRMQGVKISDKHIEVIVRQMLGKVRITSSGDSLLLVNDEVDKAKVAIENDLLMNSVFVTKRGDSKFKIAQMVEKKRYKEVASDLKKKGKTPPEARPGEPVHGEPVLLGITQAALTTESFISAASFQETTKVLTDASIQAKVDTLEGLKENVIVGHLIPAGTGLPKFRELIVQPIEEFKSSVDTDGWMGAEEPQADRVIRRERVAA